MMTTIESVGDLLREWRQRRRMSQLDLACEAGMSPAQLSCLETGRSLPARDTILQLAERLGIPLRERNAVLAAAGFGPLYQERRLDDPALQTARQMIDAILARHDPNPAMVVDRTATIVAANASLWSLVAGSDAMLLKAPVNLYRLWLHPAGLAPRITNLLDWRAHVIGQIRHRIEATGDPALSDLLEEIQDYPVPRPADDRPQPAAAEGAVVPLRLATIDGTLSFFSATTVFSAAMDITLAELSIESLFPADSATAGIMRELAVGSSS